jgi:hypothetical protein
MNNNLLYFVTGIEQIGKRKHLLYLQKAGYILHKVTNIELLAKKVEELKPGAVILAESEMVAPVLPLIKNTPIVVLMKYVRNLREITDSLPETSNLIFFRFESDPIDTILETLHLIKNFEGNEAVNE